MIDLHLYLVQVKESSFIMSLRTFRFHFHQFNAHKTTKQGSKHSTTFLGNGSTHSHTCTHSYSHSHTLTTHTPSHTKIHTFKYTHICIHTHIHSHTYMRTDPMYGIPIPCLLFLFPLSRCWGALARHLEDDCKSMWLWSQVG